ncbi:glycosyltransferase [Flammeovirga agarivorans]|uniref:Glycosyltransferase family 4 protein n=1 Tax=Flammeovirga agarivorans TaxID=2726742 RepID=A0A7X8XXE4_9BACT|nr:glycosyltransferase [Flammeovirga agarivorans]NLR93093.1 glycosyltransferase family 4 protein [Flammeovirga agarivorans]
MKKRILHIANIAGGIETYISTIINSADSDKFEFLIINGTSSKKKIYNSKGQEILQYTINIEREIKPIIDLITLFQLLKLVLKLKPDIIHCHSAKSGILGRIIGVLFNIKTFYTPHAYSFLSSQSRLKKKFFILLEKFFTYFPATTLACSSSEGSLAINILNAKESKVKIWSNSLAPITNNDIQEVLIDDIHIDKDIIITSVGRPSFQKNTIKLVQIIKEIILENPNKSIKLLLIGVGHHSPDADRVNNFILENQLSKKIKLIKWMDRKNINYLLKNSFIYISTSRYEGLPYSLLEALRLSIPIIATDVMGNNDCVINNKTGFLVNDNEEFVTKINKLLNNNKIYEEFKSNSLAFFDNKFNLDKNIDKLEYIYDQSFSK